MCAPRLPPGSVADSGEPVKVYIFLVTARGVGGTIRAAINLAGFLADEYFALLLLKPLGGQRPDMAFIDGMHLAELRCATSSGWSGCRRTGVIVFDDILPPHRRGGQPRPHVWTGDVYKVLGDGPPPPG